MSFGFIRFLDCIYKAKPYWVCLLNEIIYQAYNVFLMFRSLLSSSLLHWKLLLENFDVTQHFANKMENNFI